MSRKIEDNENPSAEVFSRESVEDESGVDVTLIRWSLSLTPAERLDHLQGFVNSILALRGNFGAK